MMSREALESRKEHKPANNAIDMAGAMGIKLLTEDVFVYHNGAESYYGVRGFRGSLRV